MQIRFHCPADGCVAIVELEPIEECGRSITCPRCNAEHPVSVTQSIRTEQMVDRCVVCGGTELFVRKDFPQRLGLGVVIVFGVAAIYFFRSSVLIAWAILASAVLVDLIIYAVIDRVTTCYACRAEYRKCVINPAHAGFELSTFEKY
ncbi:MAG: hypothetical protein ACE5HE_02340 [Phycisphaerae bacterium]